jgi:hypothetical protein
MLHLFFGSLALGAGAAVYRLFWRARYGCPISSSTTRLRGRVAALRGSLLELRAGETDHLVELAGAQPAGLRRGDRVTVDGLPALVPVSESLYRFPASRPGLSAVRLVRGTWPRLRFLDLLLVLALAGVGYSVPKLLNRPTPGRPEALVCPPGTRHGHADHIEWCELEREWKPVGAQDAVKHGPWRIWSEAGGIRQTGQFEFGRAEGEWTTFDEKGRAVHERYRDGRKL